MVHLVPALTKSISCGGGSETGEPCCSWLTLWYPVLHRLTWLKDLWESLAQCYWASCLASSHTYSKRWLNKFTASENNNNNNNNSVQVLIFKDISCIICQQIFSQFTSKIMKEICIPCNKYIYKSQSPFLTGPCNLNCPDTTNHIRIFSIGLCVMTTQGMFDATRVRGGRTPTGLSSAEAVMADSPHSLSLSCNYFPKNYLKNTSIFNNEQDKRNASRWHFHFKNILYILVIKN